MRRPLSTCIAASIVAGSLVLIAPAAQAARPTCFGKPATIVGTNGDDDGQSHDALLGTKKKDVIVGKDGNDIILGRGGNDLICGGEGDDTIAGMSGDDRSNGGPGDDQVYFGFSKHGVTASLVTHRAVGEGRDLIKSFQTIAGSELDDQFEGDSATNFMFGNGGNDLLIGGPLSPSNDQDLTDILDGGLGDDDIQGGDGFDMVSFQSREPNENGTPFGVNVDLGAGSASGEGTDQLSSMEAVWGSNQDDIIAGDAKSNFLVGADGDDQLAGGGDIDYAIFWFAGTTDPQFAGVTANLENGTATGEGNDTLANDIEGLFGSIRGDDHLTGDNKNNFIAGDAGNDTINGGGGDDWLAGGLGDDTVDGGQGNYDLIDFSTALAGVNANLGTGVATGEGADHFTNIDAIFGSFFDDTLIGDSGQNYFFSWFGNDTVNGLEGNDEIDAGPDTGDVADGGPGNNKCALAEQFTNCSDVAETDIQQHPLNQQAETVAAFRRNF